MNLSRLMVLGVLAERGPIHGHQIRRHAEITNVEAWGGVSVGSLYRELHRMEDESLVEPVRSEQVGRRPARTIYRITGEGWLELAVQREQAVREMHGGPDPLGVALQFGGFADDRAHLAELLRQRRQAIANALEMLAAERERLVDMGHIDATTAAVFRRGEVHLAAELAWHDEYAETLASEQRGAPAGAGSGAPANWTPATQGNGSVDMLPSTPSARGASS